MKAKTLAIAVLAMIAVGIGAAVFADGDADTAAAITGSGTHTAPFEVAIGSDSVTVINMSGPVAETNVKVTAEWLDWSGSGAAVESTKSFTDSNGSKLTIANDGYKTTLTPALKEGQTTATIHAAFKVTTTIGSGTTVDLVQYKYYTFVVSSADTSVTALTGLKVAEGTTFKAGVPVSGQMEASNAPTGKDPLWYATNLPKGLAMSTSGLISGTPVESGGPTTVNVTITTNDGAVFTGTVSIKVSPGTSAISLSSSVTTNDDVKAVNTSGSVDRYAANQGSDFVFTVNTTNLPAGGTLKVFATDVQSSAKKVLTPAVQEKENTYTVSTANGTGEFYISYIIEGNGIISTGVLYSVYVVDAPDGLPIQPGFSFA